MINWDKDLLQNQYKTMTLRDMGTYYGLTYERIRQVMEIFGLPRDMHREHKPHPPRYNNLSEYLAKRKMTHKVDELSYARRFLPENALCSECKSGENIIFHHIKYPASSMDDIQLLCRSCHKIKHGGKMNYINQISLYNDFNLGLDYRELQVKYGICQALVFKILRKIREGNHALNR